MQILKIEKEKGWFSKDGQNFETIDKISKEDLMVILDKFISEECEMDEYNEALLKNPAHQIIYSNIYNKLEELLPQKRILVEEGEALYQAAIDKYSDSSEI